MLDAYEEEYENQNLVVDCDILEAAKENIQPLAGGRRVTALASVLATPHGLRDVMLEAARGRLRERVREAQARVDGLRALKEEERTHKGGDKENGEEEDETAGEEGGGEELTLEEAEEILLDAYVRLVTWTVEHYPRGQSAASGILEQLEEATRVLRSSDFAKADPRYLNLWIRYASYVDHPEVIYEFLLANEIGTKWAKLYEEYASLLEKINRRPKADEIYLLGTARKAEPLDHLERRHREFQKRMMVAAPVFDTVDTSHAEAATTSSSDTQPRRRVLAESSSTSTTATSSTPLTSTSTFDTFSIPSSSSSLASMGSQGKARPNGRIPVFVDPAGEAESARGNAWPELGTRAERVKENKRAAEKMQGAVLKQRGAAKAATKEVGARARGAPKIVPYRDPEPSSKPSESTSKFVPFRDPEAAVVSPPTNSGAQFVPFKDPEAAVVPPATNNGAKFVPFKDPEPESAPSRSSANFVPFKDPVCTSSAGKASKITPFKDPEPVLRRSSRLGSKKPEKSIADTEPLPEIAEGDDAPTTSKVAPVITTTKFVPFRDEDAGQGRAAAQTNDEKVMRPKLGATSELGGVKATSEAEALRKNPFKNYKDL